MKASQTKAAAYKSNASKNRPTMYSLGARKLTSEQSLEQGVGAGRPTRRIIEAKRILEAIPQDAANSMRTEAARKMRHELEDQRERIRPRGFDHTRARAAWHKRGEASPSSMLLEPSGIKLLSAPMGTDPTYIDIAQGDIVQHGVLQAIGSGSGFDWGSIAATIFLGQAWLTWEVKDAEADKDGAVAIYEFVFIAPEDGTYQFSVVLGAYGTYELTADDGVLDSQEAGCEIFGVLEGKTGTFLLQRSDDNIAEADSFLSMEEHTALVYCRKNIYQTYRAAVVARVWAKGEGARARIDLADPHGGMFCLGLQVTPV